MPLSTPLEKYYPLLADVRLEFIDTAAAAHYLGRKPQCLRRWSCEGKGPVKPRNVGGRLAWPVSEIRAALGVRK